MIVDISSCRVGFSPPTNNCDILVGFSRCRVGFSPPTNNCEIFWWALVVVGWASAHQQTIVRYFGGLKPTLR
ncbi:hypothetical protein EYD09_00120 [Haemophilus influenzae]|nr:hypothetical protein [Haemophilus influenzae]